MHAAWKLSEQSGEEIKWFNNINGYTNIKPYSILVCVRVNDSFIGHSLKHFSRISDSFIPRKIQMIGYYKSRLKAI